MNGSVPGYLSALILGGAVATVVAVLAIVNRGLKRAGWTDDARRSATGSIAALLIVWFFAELVAARLGFFQRNTRIPTILYGILLPLAGGVVLFRRWRLPREVVEAVPQEWIVGVQFYRVEGVVFLMLYDAGLLPGVFARPAGWGDLAVGLLAPVVGMAYARWPRSAGRWVAAWNVLGLVDLAVALTTGFLSSPSKFQMLAFDRPNVLIGALPLVMIPVFLVPLAVLLHLASLRKLRLGERSLKGYAADAVIGMASNR